MPRLDYQFPSFSGGLADRLSDDVAQPNQLRICRNVDFTKASPGGVTANYLIRRTNLAPLGDANIIRIFDCKSIVNNWRWLIIADDGYFYVVDDNLDEINRRGRWDNAGALDQAQNVLFEDNVIYFVGVQDGNYYPSLKVLVDTYPKAKTMGFYPASFSLSNATSGGSIDDGWHCYQIIYVDSNGHRSAPLKWSHRKQVESVGGAGNVHTVTISGLSHDYERIYIYRTVSSGGTGEDNKWSDDDEFDPANYPVFYLVDVIDGGNTSYADTASDATIVSHDVLNTDADVPSTTLFDVAVLNGIMFGFTRESSNLLYTPLFDYGNWPPTNVIPIGGTEAIRAIRTVGDKLLLFKENSIFAFWGNSRATFDYRQLTNIYGTNYIKTIQVIDNSIVIFLDEQERVILFDGSKFHEISKSINIEKGSSYWSCLFKEYYVLFYRVGTTSLDYPPSDIVAYAFHLPTGAWSKWENTELTIPPIPNQSMTDIFLFGDDMGKLSVLGGDEVNYIYAPFEIRTHDVHCGSPLQKKSFKEFELLLELNDNAHSFDGMIGQLEIIIDGGLDTESVIQKQINYDTSDPQRIQKYRIHNGANGTRVSLRFVGNDNMKNISLMGARLYWEPRGTPRR